MVIHRIDDTYTYNTYIYVDEVLYNTSMIVLHYDLVYRAWTHTGNTYTPIERVIEIRNMRKTSQHGSRSQIGMVNHTYMSM